MSTSIRVVCYKSKTLANGENPLMVCVSKDGKRKYQSLGISIHAKFWDFHKGQTKQSCPNREQINKIIADKIAELQSAALSMIAENKSYTSSTLLVQVKDEYVEKSLREAFEALILQMEDNVQIGNLHFYRRTYNSLKSFSKGQLDIPFSTIDCTWLSKYEKWLRSKHNKETSISIVFRTLRSVFNKAIANKWARKADYPFEEFKINKFDTKTVKRAISKKDVRAIYQHCATDCRSPYYELAKDIFMFSYLCGGINFVDISNLKIENIIDGRLTYIRQKTAKRIKIGLPQQALDIINKYKAERKGYLFPIFDEAVHITPTQKHNRIHKVLAKLNKHLRSIGKDLDLPVDLTTYVARHTFATVLKKSGVEIALISEMLGHADLATTQIYLDSFDDEQVDEAMKNLL